MSNSNNWLDGILGLGLAAIVGYGAYKGIEYLADSQRQAEEEDQRRRIDNARSLALAQQAEKDRQRQQV